MMLTRIVYNQVTYTSEPTDHYQVTHEKRPRALKLKELKCPTCGGALGIYTRSIKLVECKYCGNIIEVYEEAV